VEQFKKRYRGRVNVNRAAVLADGAQSEDAWHLIAGES